jgi:CRISPR-associated protein Cmr6
MRRAIIDLGKERNRGTHAGLILQRYLTVQSNPEDALLGAARQAASSEPLRALYAQAFARWVESFREHNPHRSQRLAVAGRLVVGLGTENVLETGLRLHHTYGVPIIPGSALKGVASHYCHEVWGQRHNENASQANTLFRRGEKYHSLLFGTTEDGGVITFHDAWLLPQSLDGSLRLDVMTPHHPNWQTGEAPPTDFDSPNPVSFLSVTGTFEVRLSWSGPAATPEDRAEAWTELAMQLLREALAEWGVGGKTSSGYGRLVDPARVNDGRQTGSFVADQPVVLPKPGELVDARLLEQRTKGGGWRAMHEPSGLSGPIHNTTDVPTDKKADDRLKLVVASANVREIAFRYPTEADQARARQAPNKNRNTFPRGSRKK